MIGSEWQPVPWWKTALIIGGPFLIFMGLLMALCSRPTPPEPSPSVAPSPPAAIASSTATASQTVRISIRKPATKQLRDSQATTSQEGAEATFEDGPVRLDPQESAGDEVITVEFAQTVSAAANSASSPVGSVDKTSTIDHARLGAFVGTVPGAIALTYQLAALDVPSDVFGTKLQLGLDVEGNLSQVGVGVSVGGKAFATAGGYMGWTGPGWFLGLGLRF